VITTVKVVALLAGLLCWAIGIAGACWPVWFGYIAAAVVVAVGSAVMVWACR
jgi:hypothetical protein